MHFVCGGQKNIPAWGLGGATPTFAGTTRKVMPGTIQNLLTSPKKRPVSPRVLMRNSFDCHRGGVVGKPRGGDAMFFDFWCGAGKIWCGAAKTPRGSFTSTLFRHVGVVESRNQRRAWMRGCGIPICNCVE